MSPSPLCWVRLAVRFLFLFQIKPLGVTNVLLFVEPDVKKRGGSNSSIITRRDDATV
jgi:hypothetical protein